MIAHVITVMQGRKRLLCNNPDLLNLFGKLDISPIFETSAVEGCCIVLIANRNYRVRAALIMEEYKAGVFKASGLMHTTYKEGFIESLLKESNWVNQFLDNNEHARAVMFDTEMIPEISIPRGSVRVADHVYALFKERTEGV